MTVCMYVQYIENVYDPFVEGFKTLSTSHIYNPQIVLYCEINNSE